MPYSSISELPASVKKGMSKRGQQIFREAFNAALKQGRTEQQAFRIAYAAVRKAGLSTSQEQSRKVPAKERRKLAEENKALPDGSFPIANAQDLKNAIQTFGRAKNKAAAKRHIIKRARALGLTNLLPDSWKSDQASLLTCQDCGREGFTKQALVDHAQKVHTHNEIRDALQDAIKKKLDDDYLGQRIWPWVQDVADDWFIYNVDGRLFRAAWSMNDSVITIGNPVPVRERRVYEVVKEED